MANTNATEFRNILVDMPDFPGAEVEYWLLTRFAANGTEAFPKKKYIQTLDANGQGTQALPVPSTGAWLYRVVTPDGKPPYNPTLAAGADLQLTTWLASAQSTVAAASLVDQFAALTDFDAHVADTTAVHGITDTSLLETTAGAQAKADAAEAASEPDLGNPLVDGHVLSSTIAGVRSWVEGGGGASDVGDLTTTGLTSPNLLRVAAAGGLEERTPAQVVSDIGVYATSAYSAAPTAAEPLKADGSGGIDFAGAVNASKYTIAATNALQIAGTNLFVGSAGAGFTGTGSIGVGTNALSSTATNSHVAVGLGAGSSMTAGSLEIVAVGPYAGYQNGGDRGVFFGSYAGNANTGSRAVGIGPSALKSNTGARCIGIGYQAGQSNAFNECLMLGHYTQATKANQAIFGAENAIGTRYINALTIVSGPTGGTIEGWGKSSTTGQTAMARVAWAWTDSTHATRQALLTLYASDYNGERTGVAVGANGTEATLGFYGVTPTARQLLATGAGATVDQVITALQNLGLLKQA